MFRLLLILLAAATAYTQSLEFRTLDENVLQTRLRLATGNNAE